MRVLLPLFLLLCSCSSKAMNGDGYSCVDIGMSEQKLVECYGCPYATCTKEDGSKVLEYIERFDGYQRKIMQVNYFITVKNGVVVHKCSKTSYPPGYMYDSLDYQSQKETRGAAKPL